LLKKDCFVSGIFHIPPLKNAQYYYTIEKMPCQYEECIFCHFIKSGFYFKKVVEIIC